ncbi:MAG TPA: transposase [Bacteroidia bacterium]|nr:transposase [Bacteroidia bacterium]
MRKSKFTEVQIVAILAQYEQGVKVADICREHGISQPTFYQCQRKYSGMEVSELKRLKEMEQELAQFKRIVADLTLQNRVLKDVIEKKL